MDPGNKKILIANNDMLVDSLSINSASFNKLLDIFFGAGILPEESYDEFTVEYYHVPKQVKGNIKSFLQWMRKSPERSCYDQFCLALKEIGLNAELSLLQASEAKENQPENQVPAVSSY